MDSVDVLTAVKNGIRIMEEGSNKWHKNRKVYKILRRCCHWYDYHLYSSLFKTILPTPMQYKGECYTNSNNNKFLAA